MSNTEHIKGKLVPINPLLDIETVAKAIITEEFGEVLEDHYTSYTEQLEDIGYRYFHISNDIIYRIDSEEIGVDEDIFLAHKETNGIISFEVKFYNGGCSIDEALDIAIGNI